MTDRSLLCFRAKGYKTKTVTTLSQLCRNTSKRHRSCARILSMKAFVTICGLLCLVPAFHAAPQLTCVRSLKCNTLHQGCYLVEGLCHCTQAFCCNNPFNYSSLDSCLAANAFQLEDPCKDAPCKNNGYCLQRWGSYHCDCHGTGYFGPRCHEKCPKDVRKEINRYRGSKAEFARNRTSHLMACLYVQ